MDEDLLQKLSNYFIWSNPEYFKDEMVEEVVICYFSYYSSWKVSVMQKYKNKKHSEQISKDKTCKYIIDKCFDKNKFTDNYREIIVKRPSGHQTLNSCFQLKKLLNLEESK